MVKLCFSVFGGFMRTTFTHNTKTITYNFIKKVRIIYSQTQRRTQRGPQKKSVQLTGCPYLNVRVGTKKTVNNNEVSVTGGVRLYTLKRHQDLTDFHVTTLGGYLNATQLIFNNYRIKLSIGLKQGKGFRKGAACPPRALLSFLRLEWEVIVPGVPCGHPENCD